MPLDELTDDQLDRQLRELLPPAPRSQSWERAQRERLIHYITTGDPKIPLDTAHPDHGEGGQLLELAPTRTAPARPRRWWILTSAAAAIALLGGLVVAQRPADAPAPAQQPGTASEPPADVPSDSVPSLPAGAVEPDRFGVVTDTWPTAASASAGWGSLLGSDATAAEALVARSDADHIRDGITLTVHPTDTDDHYLGTPQQRTVAGLDVEVYVEPGTPAITTVVLPGTPALAVSGLDPIAFVEAAGGFPIHGARVDDNGEATFAVDALPDGYDVIVPPTRRAIGSIDAWTRASDGDGGDGIAVRVGVTDPRLAWAQVGDLQQIDINGNTGWLHDSGSGSSVHWQASDTTWASVVGASTVDDALRFARAIELVDQATWTERYNVERPEYPTLDELNAAGTPPPPASTIAKP